MTAATSDRAGHGSRGASWDDFSPAPDGAASMPGDARPDTICVRLMIGLGWTAVTRGLTVMLSYFIVWPGFGMNPFFNSAREHLPWIYLGTDTAVALILAGGAMTAIVGLTLHGDGSRINAFTHRLGWAYAIDNVVYIGGLLIGATVLMAHSYPGLGGYAAILSVPQTVTLTLAIGLVRRTRVMVSRSGPG